MAPETDREKAFSCETRGTVLGVLYDTNRWTWNLDSEKVKITLHDLYDMMHSSSMTNEVAMRVSGNISHYAPLFPWSKWWKSLSPACQTTTHARRRSCRSLHLPRRLQDCGLRPSTDLVPCQLKDPLYYSISVYTDASGVHNDRNRLQRGGGYSYPITPYEGSSDLRMRFGSEDMLIAQLCWSLSHACKA